MAAWASVGWAWAIRSLRVPEPRLRRDLAMAARSSTIRAAPDTSWVLGWVRSTA